MQKSMMIAMAVAIAVGSPALAGKYNGGKYNGGKYLPVQTTEASATTNAGAGGQVYDGRGKIVAKTDGNVLIRTDTSPITYAAAIAAALGRVDGSATGKERADIGLGTDVSTTTEAVVGNNGVFQRSGGGGSLDSIAAAAGQRTRTAVYGNIESGADSLSVNTNRGGATAGNADTTVAGGANAQASGREQASASVSISGSADSRTESGGFTVSDAPGV